MTHKLYVRVLDGEIIGKPEWFDDELVGDQSLLAEGKPRLYEMQSITDEYDPVTHTYDSLVVDIQEENLKVVHHHRYRPKNEDEITAMKWEKDTAIESVYFTLYNAPIQLTVNGTEYTFHADQQARENITGILDMYNVQDRLIAQEIEIENPINDPRPYNPMGTLPIMISRDQIGCLGHAIGVRKDKLYTIKKTKQYLLWVMTDPADVHAVDPNTGWEIE